MFEVAGFLAVFDFDLVFVLIHSFDLLPARHRSDDEKWFTAVPDCFR